MSIPKPWKPITAFIALGFLYLFASPLAGATDDTSQNTPLEREYPHAPAWTADQTLYEVNLRQFSAEGNVEGLRKQLPRLKELGVGTLWLMPVNPIGSAGRCTTCASP